MRIVASQLRPFAIAGPVARAAACVVLTDETGRQAAGEASSIAGFSPDSLDEAMHAMDAVRASIDAIDDHIARVLAVTRALAPHAALLDPCPTARFAFETALFQLISFRREVGVASCLGDTSR